MTLPAFSAAGTGSTGNPSWPTHATGHFGLLLIEFDGSNNPSTPSGWNVIPGFPVTQPSTKVAGYYRFATSSSESAPTISITAEDHHWAVIITYTGVNTINPFHIVSTTSSASIALKTFPGFTTFLKDSLIVNVLAWGLDNAGPLFSGETNADLGSLTERYDAGTISASGGGLYVNDGTKSAKGDFTYTQVTPSTNTISNGAAIALQAADQSFGTKSQIINSKRRTMEVLQSTAQDWRFTMFDSADGVTGKTGLTLAVTIQKQGDTSFGSISPTVTEIGSGHYNSALTTTHMNTLGCTSLRSTATGAIPADCPNCLDVVLRNKQDGVRQGMTALPNAAAEAAGGLYTRGTGAGQINQDGNGRIDANAVRVDGVALGTHTAGYFPADTRKHNGTSPNNLSAAGNYPADVEEVNASNTAVSTTVPSRLNASGQFPSNVLRVNASTTAASNLGLQFDGTGLTGGTFPAPQSQITTLSSDSAAGLADLQSRINAVDDYVDTEIAAIKAKTDNLPSDPADASDVAGAFSTVNATLATVASYIDTEVAAIKAKTDNLPSDPADQSLLIAATDAIFARLGAPVGASISADIAAVANSARDALLDYAYRTGRTFRGFLRRVGSAFEFAENLDDDGPVQYFQPDGTTPEWSVTQDVGDGTRTAVDLGTTETP